MMTEHAPCEAGGRPSGVWHVAEGLDRLIAQVAFVASWAPASNWQGPQYRAPAADPAGLSALFT